MAPLLSPSCLPPDGSCTLVDVRSPSAHAYDTIPGALSVPDIVKRAEEGTLTEAAFRKPLLLFCMYGRESAPMAERLRDLGYDASILEGGFSAFIRSSLPERNIGEEVMEDLGKKDVKKKLLNRFTRAIREFDLLAPGDRIAVCISGGKDSMLMAKLFQQLKKSRKDPFDLVFLSMDPGYSPLNREVIEADARALDIPLTFFSTPIFDAVDQVGDKPCFLCARMRRGYLYRKAQELGCNKIALGHHFDDVIETTLMAMLWGGQAQTMVPKVRSENVPGMELIRPMYYIREEDILAWRDRHSLHFIQCACHFTEGTGNSREHTASRRLQTKLLIRELKKDNPYVEGNIFNSMQHVNLDTVLSYRLNGVNHEFSEIYANAAGETDRTVPVSEE